MNDTRAFQPLYGPTSGFTQGSLFSSITVAASGTHAASTQLTQQGGGYYQVQIANTSAAWAYVQFGQYGNVKASTVATGYPVAPGGVVVVSVPPEANGADVILSTGTGNVIFTVGGGL